MVVKIAINGFGRIGRMILRCAYYNEEFRKNFQVTAINDLTSPEALAYLLKHDSVHGTFNENITFSDTTIAINGDEPMRVYAEKDPLSLPWKDDGIEYVIESTGLYTDRLGASKHITSGARKVIVSAPGKDMDATIVMGVNHNQYNNERHNIVSMGSCTTNSIAPPLKVMLDEFGIKQGFMTTVHSYTNDQRILDLPHRDFRRARAAAVNVIPTTTGAAKAIGEVIPELKGKLDGISLRVPTPCGSISDLTLDLEKEVTKEDVNNALKKASEGSMKGVMKYSEEDLVTTDIINETHTAIIDSKLTNVVGGKGNFTKIFSWYDNEYGFSAKVVELANYMKDKE